MELIRPPARGCRRIRNECFLSRYGNEFTEGRGQKLVPMCFQPVTISLRLVESGMDSRDRNGIGDLFQD